MHFGHFTNVIRRPNFLHGTLLHLPLYTFLSKLSFLNLFLYIIRLLSIHMQEKAARIICGSTVQLILIKNLSSSQIYDNFKRAVYIFRNMKKELCL